MAYTLLLRLAGPLQSWGVGSYYKERHTEPLPTKSGVTGLLAAALGRNRGEPLDDLSALRFGVRVDEKGRIIRDYQITDMGPHYNAVISNRYYISDGIFLVGLEASERNTLESLEEALKSPIYTPYLGRKSCPPTQPLVLGIRDKNLEDALNDEDWTLQEWRKVQMISMMRGKTYLPIYVECEDGDIFIKDVALNFDSQNRQYRYRRMRRVKSKVITRESLDSKEAKAAHPSRPVKVSEMKQDYFERIG